MTSRHPEHVIVIGAGAVGLSTAWHLQRHGIGVTVLDRAGVAADSSWGNAGWLAPALTLPLPEPAVLRYGIRAVFDPASPVYVPPSADPRLLQFLVTFAAHCTKQRWESSMAVFAELNKLALGAYDELSDGGVAEPVRTAEPFLAAFANEADRQVLAEEFRYAGEHGAPVDHAFLTGDQARAVEPVLGEGVRAAITIEGQRFIDPPRFVNSLADAVRARGGAIISGFEVDEILDHGRTGVEVLDRNGATQSADAVVLASGARLNALARRFGVRTIVQAGRGYSFTVRPDRLPENPVYLPTQRVACTPLQDRFRVAGMMEFRRPDAPRDDRRIRAIIDAARPMLTGIDWDVREEEWVGSRPCTADGLPLVGGTRSPRVHVAGGHGMWGIALGPLTGRLLADQMTGEPTPAVMAHFDPLRRGGSRRAPQSGATTTAGLPA
ncbi:NAD(P)/FAD-dependent oxidoreductase [Occultella gossypii]|uniref:FAD-binding oxidoreductase n=1 Tax=Occultella gossypii TaxID=2800820 RepID=A0ABS7SBV9_9MICO|nr:FAD-dependent oxidoreductase [Occultella gossypii]MBZ2197851.1 FAD-binding oxidoreductase [Occultella gossypii]